jgi:hypothetical protein
VNQEMRDLEAAALAAHYRGMTWATFWQQHGADVAAAEPHDRQRYHRLRQRLLRLLVAGDLDGQQAVGDTMPWEARDAPPVPVISDTETMARCRWAPGPEATT